MPLITRRLSRRLLPFVAALILGFVPAAMAGAPQTTAQAPGYYRVMIGRTEVTALFDGINLIDAKLLKNAKEAEVRRLLARQFVDHPKMQTAVNAFLVNTGSQLALIDTGAGKLYGPALGNVLQNLKSAGYKPEQVDAVILTHLHGDHVAGLNDAENRPVFNNATVHVAQTESDFWLSPEREANAPEGIKRRIKMVRQIAEPYLAQGKWKTFMPGTHVAPGIFAVAAPGHTPGHTAFAVESDGQRLLIWGDLVHCHAIQFARPDVAIEFDVDLKQAVATRLAIFRQVAESKELVAGMHLPFPGIGRVHPEGKDTYRWVPVEFAPLK